MIPDENKWKKIISQLDVNEQQRNKLLETINKLHKTNKEKTDKNSPQLANKFWVELFSEASKLLNKDQMQKFIKLIRMREKNSKTHPQKNR